MTVVLGRGWLIMGVACLAAAGCVVAGGGGGYGYDGGLPGEYYQPAGFAYGGWGPGYNVGPYHGGGHYAGGYAGHGGHYYRPASGGGRGMPGLPAGGHSGGGHGGGGHR